MPKKYVRSAKDDENLPEPGQQDDAEGHMFLPNDPTTAGALARGRSADIEREARDRQRQKEVRPNRR